MGILLSLAALVSANAGEPVFSISLNVQEGPSVTVLPIGEASIALPACRGIIWERFNPKTDEFDLLSTRPCEGLALSVPVGRQGESFPVPPELGIGSGERVRVTVVVGVDCQPDLPLELAQCQRYEQRVDRGTIP